MPNAVTIYIDHALALVLLVAFWASALLGAASTALLLCQSRFRLDQTIIITKGELALLYGLFTFDRAAAAMAMMAPSYPAHLINACAKVALASALALSVLAMIRRLRVISKVEKTVA
jgi:hypothetical protein